MKLRGRIKAKNKFRQEAAYTRLRLGISVCLYSNLNLSQQDRPQHPVILNPDPNPKIAYAYQTIQNGTELGHSLIENVRLPYFSYSVAIVSVPNCIIKAASLTIHTFCSR